MTTCQVGTPYGKLYVATDHGVFIGGDGHDVLVGAAAHDVLIGGRTQPAHIGAELDILIANTGDDQLDTIFDVQGRLLIGTDGGIWQETAEGELSLLPRSQRNRHVMALFASIRLYEGSAARLGDRTGTAQPNVCLSLTRKSD